MCFGEEVGFGGAKKLHVGTVELPLMEDTQPLC